MYDEEYDPVNGHGYRGTIHGTTIACHCGCGTTMKGAETEDVTGSEYPEVMLGGVSDAQTIFFCPVADFIEATPRPPTLSQESTGCFTTAGGQTIAHLDTLGNT